MNKTEAREIAEKDLEFYRAMSYEEIAAKLDEQESYERVTENGERTISSSHQMEVL